MTSDATPTIQPGWLPVTSEFCAIQFISQLENEILLYEKPGFLCYRSQQYYRSKQWILKSGGNEVRGITVLRLYSGWYSSKWMVATSGVCNHGL